MIRRIVPTIGLVLLTGTVFGQSGPSSDVRLEQTSGARARASDFRGVTTDGKAIPGLFAIRSTSVSTEPVRQAASAFLTTLSREQRVDTQLPVDDPEWQRWTNQRASGRHGLSFAQMNPRQDAAAIALLRASLSAKGLQQTRDIMRLEHTLGELTGGNRDGSGEKFYFFTMFGVPSPTEPWGWQLEGHHLIINYFVLGDQVVMTPTFMGSEPAVARAGKYKGIAVLQGEQTKGLALITALNDTQRAKAVLRSTKGPTHSLAEAYKDDVILAYAGIRADELVPAQRTMLIDLIAEHVTNMREGHAKVRMDEVRRHLDQTWFAWVGGTDADDVFYYRVHSPVILIEFDHTRPIYLPGPTSRASRDHIHTIVRTPNGNDYGKDYLRQHYERHQASHQH